MRLISRSPRPILIAFFVLALALAATTASFSSAEPDAADQEARDVAREILKIQRDLGGSVVKLPEELSGGGSWSDAPRPVTDADPSGTKDPVLALRQAGLQLDLLAHRLELLDLYPQADAARELAQRMRKDARQLKQAETTVKPD